MSMVMKFDASALNYINHGNAASMQMANDMTIEAIIKHDVAMGAGAYCALIEKGLASLAGHEYSLWLNRADWRAYFFIRKPDNLQSNFVVTTGAVSRNVWHTITATHEGNNLNIYVDGAFNNTAAPGYAGQFVANQEVDAYYAADIYYTGIGAGVRLYNRALSANEIAYNYTHPQNPVRRGCVLCTTQESLFAGTWRDLSGSANHGTLTANPQIIPHNNLAGRQVSL